MRWLAYTWTSSRRGELGWWGMWGMEVMQVERSFRCTKSFFPPQLGMLYKTLRTLYIFQCHIASLHKQNLVKTISWMITTYSVGDFFFFDIMALFGTFVTYMYSIWSPPPYVIAGLMQVTRGGPISRSIKYVCHVTCIIQIYAPSCDS